MRKQSFDVDKLRVAAPCAVGWETMTGDARVRHCHSCRLNVYNIAEMTKSEAETLIANSEGRLCIRLYKRADGTILTKDCPVGLRAYYKKTVRFASATLAAIFGLFSVSLAQEKEKTVIESSQVKILQTAVASQESVLQGKISDGSKNVVTGAEIKLTGKNKNVYLTKSDDDGNYRIAGIETGIYELEIKSAGFITLQITQIIINNSQQNQFDAQLQVDPTLTIISGVALTPLPIKNPDFSKLLIINPPTKPKKHKKHSTKN